MHKQWQRERVLIDSTKTLSSFNSVNETKLEEDVDLDCNTGREHYLSTTSPTPMTRNAIHTNKPQPKRHDGLRHTSLPVTGKHCQYCLFQYTHDFDDNQREANPKMERNWANVR